jgi:hypothetical protein
MVKKLQEFYEKYFKSAVLQRLDRQTCERSNLLTLCDKGDSIMADKGFNVQDLFAPYDVTINIPTFGLKLHNIKQTNVSSLASFVSVTFKGSFRILYVFASPIILSI